MTSPQDPSNFQPYPDPSAAREGVDRPRAVEAAFWIAVVVPIVGTALLAASLYLLQDLFASATGGLPPEQQQMLSSQFGRNFVLALFATMLGCYVVLTALWIAFGVKLRAGRNWARITLTFFAALWLVNALSSVATGSSPAGGLQPSGGGPVALGVAQTALGVVGMLAFLVLVWNGRANRYFAAAENARARPDQTRG